jgi:hypothetical protein
VGQDPNASHPETLPVDPVDLKSPREKQNHNAAVRERGVVSAGIRTVLPRNHPPARAERVERTATCQFLTWRSKASFAAALNVLKIPFRVFSSGLLVCR